MSTSKDAPRGPNGRRNIHIYIDNSQFWIHGQKAHAKKESLTEPWDPTFHLDVGRLKKVLIQHSGVGLNEDTGNVMVNIYGSSPPPVDTLWKECETHKAKVVTFAQESWTENKGDVNAQIAIEATADMELARKKPVASIFIIVSGEKNLHRTALKIVNKGFQLHVWSWKDALAEVYRKSQPSNHVEVHLLDDHLDTIGYHQNKFRISRSTINPGSIVIANCLNKVDEIKELISLMRIAVYCYETPREPSATDLLIVTADSKDLILDKKIFDSMQVLIKAHDLKVLAYSNYIEDHSGSSEIEINVSDNFAEFSKLEDGIAYYISGGDEEVERKPRVKKRSSWRNAGLELLACIPEHKEEE